MHATKGAVRSRPIAVATIVVEVSSSQRCTADYKAGDEAPAGGEECPSDQACGRNDAIDNMC